MSQGNSLIVTYTGRIIDPINPHPDDIAIEDIAHALANSCRWTGHVRKFYSVAEHSVRVATHLPQKLHLDGLLHDASEAYLSDLSRPIKQHSGLGYIYLEVEARLMQVISDKFLLDWPMHPLVKDADNQLLWAEVRDLMPPMKDDRLLQWSTETTYKQIIEPWDPVRAEAMFLGFFSGTTEGPLP